MKNKIRLIVFTLIISLGLSLNTNAALKNTKYPVKAPSSIQKTKNVVYTPASSLDIVANPAKYLNKGVKIKAKFDKFSTLGLDYKPAYRSSEKYITFLIKRDDVVGHVIPLSEMKNFLDRKTAEKYVDLATGDSIEYSGIVFSNALGDVWIDVVEFTILNQPKKEEKSIKK